MPTPAPLGTPIVLFAPKDKELMKGDCTMVQWNVQNVREVYYENLPENGQGEREECMRKAEDQVYYAPGRAGVTARRTPIRRL